MATQEITCDFWNSTYVGFITLADSLQNSPSSDQSAALKQLLDYCAQNPVMRFITDPLLNMEVGLDHFLSAPNRPRDLTKLALPDDPGERLAFIYQLLWRIQGKLFALSSSAIAGQDIYLSIIEGIHRKFVIPFLSEIKTRLERINRKAQKSNHLALSDLKIIR